MSEDINPLVAEQLTAKDTLQIKATEVALLIRQAKEASQAIQSIAHVLEVDASYSGCVPEPRIDAGDVEGLATAAKLLASSLWFASDDFEKNLIRGE